MQDFDYIVVGGGLAGCTLASCLSRSKTSPSVLLIEAGSDVSKHPLTQFPFGCFGAAKSDIDWDYTSVPQRHLENRQIYIAGGKGLGGSTAINYGTWTRGPAHDYDRLARLAGDERWSYAGQVPYLEMIEKNHVVNVTVSQSHPDRKSPLREKLLKAWLELGLEQVESANSGHPLGIGEFVENWKEGRRQLASNAFDLSGVTIMTETTVQKILLEERSGQQVAVGVQLVDGRKLTCVTEVILSAGTYRTPQLLMLSGVGPRSDLEKVNVPVLVDLPDVGKNLHDHLLMPIDFRFKDPLGGWALGGSAGPWADPIFQLGLPADWIVSENVPWRELEDAVRQDGLNDQAQALRDYANSLQASEVVHFEAINLYATLGPPIYGHTPMDGAHMVSCIGLLSPTSRGTVTVLSSLASDKPVADPEYLATETDRAIMRYAVRRVLKAHLEHLSEVVEADAPPASLPPLTLESSDAEIDARVRRIVQIFYHGAGTASIGTVVDSELRVKGVKNLRVMDASVLPEPIGGHYQAILYAMAAQAAEMIAASALS